MYVYDTYEHIRGVGHFGENCMLQYTYDTEDKNMDGIGEYNNDEALVFSKQSDPHLVIHLACCEDWKICRIIPL